MHGEVFISCGINNSLRNIFIVANTALILWLVDIAEQTLGYGSKVQRFAYNKQSKCVLSVNVLLYHSSHWHHACLNG